MSVRTLPEAKATGKDYGYCNARVRGMKSRLLNRTFLDGLMDCPDLKGVISSLSGTEYGSDLDTTLLHGHTFEAVDEALKNNMTRTYQKVLRIINGEAYFLVTTLLGRWDLFNVKTIIRGKHMHLTADEILDGLMPAGQLKPVELKALAAERTVKAVVDLLTTWQLPFGVPLRREMGAYAKEEDLSILELALDKYFSEWASERLDQRKENYRIARDVLALQTDASNLLTVFRLLHADLADKDASRFFLPGGLHVNERLFKELAAMSDIDEVLDRLRRTPYGPPLEASAVKYVETGSIATLERVLEDFVMRRTLAYSNRDPLGAGVVISYLWAKQNEVTNLRIIVKGNSVGMPAETVRGELILV